MRPEKTA